MTISRREMLGLLSGSTFFLSATGKTLAQATLPARAPGLVFAEGVGSGDPQADAIMLWTRAVPAGEQVADIPVLLQLSDSEDFSRPLLESVLHTSASSDYTLRAYVDGLAADTHYYYRFLGAAGTASRTGRTRTAPSPDQARGVNLAFASCQSYQNGFYGSWARMLADDAAAPEAERIQFVLHLGDFIYERCWHTRSDGTPQSRQVPDFPDGVNSELYRHAVSLEDYRLLYRTYLRDPHLQAARARWPFVCTWDDHEFANDNFQSFVTYGGGAELDARRKQASSQAWFEYIPTTLDQLDGQPAHDFRENSLDGDAQQRNRAAVDSLRIYRRLNWGQNLDIVLTDSRSYRSPPCLPDGLAASLGLPLNTVQLVEMADAGEAYNGGNPPATLPYGDGTTPNPGKGREPGTLLGREQREWFLGTLESSDARWKLWGNALPLLPMRLDMSALPFTDYQDSIFNIDSWAGYPYEVAYMMDQLEEQGVTGLVSLSGDHHMHGAGTVSRSATDPEASPVCVDFTVAGISSSSLFTELFQVAREKHPDFQPIVYTEQDGEITPVWNLSMLQGVFAAYTYTKTGLESVSGWLGPNEANPGLAYVDTMANGYGLASFSAERVQVKMITMQDCRSPFVEPPAIRHTATFELPHWQPGKGPELLGPQFDGGAPFPFEPRTV